MDTHNNKYNPKYKTFLRIFEIQLLNIFTLVFTYMDIFHFMFREIKYTIIPIITINLSLRSIRVCQVAYMHADMKKLRVNNMTFSFFFVYLMIFSLSSCFSFAFLLFTL